MGYFINIKNSQKILEGNRQKMKTCVGTQNKSNSYPHWLKTNLNTVTFFFCIYVIFLKACHAYVFQLLGYYPQRSIGCSKI